MQPALRCPLGREPFQRSELFFGLAQADGSAIDERRFAAFVDDVVAPSFRAGFTLFAAHGQYLGQNGQVVREPGRVLIVLHRGEPDTERALELVRARYRLTFVQESVLRADTPSCVSF